MTRIVLCAVATVLSLVYAVLCFLDGSAYDEMVASIDSKEFVYPELFYIGFHMSRIMKIDTKSRKANLRIKEIGEVYGERYAEYYYYVMYAAKWTYSLSALTGMALLAALVNNPSSLFFGIIIAALLVSHVDGKVNDKLKARKTELISQMPQMLSKLALLVNSGMPMRDAWKRVAESNDGLLYREMRKTTEEIRDGAIEFEAYKDFGNRCNVKEVKRFASTMVQNLTKGNSEISFLLREMSDEMWSEKRNLAKQEGAAASSKLMIPSAVIFLGIMMLVMIPAFMNMGI